MTYLLYERNAETKQAELAPSINLLIEAAEASQESHLAKSFADWQVCVQPERHQGTFTDGAYVSSCRDRISAR